MPRSFASGKRTNIVQETKQIQAALIGVLASIQNRSEQTIDTFSQHTAAPGTAQEVAEFIPSRPELYFTQLGQGFIQAVLPHLLLAGLLQHRQRVTLLIGLNL